MKLEGGNSLPLATAEATMLLVIEIMDDCLAVMEHSTHRSVSDLGHSSAKARNDGLDAAGDRED